MCRPPQDFLAEMSQYFEIVIFTDEPNSYADPVLNRLDVNHVIPYRLYRPETQYHKGKHVRDLSKLNRDLSQVGRVCRYLYRAVMFLVSGPHLTLERTKRTKQTKPLIFEALHKTPGPYKVHPCA